MQTLYITALLLSAVAAQLVLETPDTGDEGSGGQQDSSQTMALSLRDWQARRRANRNGPRRRPNGSNRRPSGPKLPGKMEFSLVFKVENLTFKNVTDVPLKEGENLFLMPKFRGSGPRHHKQYVKLCYNSTEPTTVSFEFGVLKPMKQNDQEGDGQENSV